MQSFLLDRVTLLFYIVTVSTVTCLYLSHVMLIKVYGVASDPGLTFTQSPTIDENDEPLTFTSALHGKIQIDICTRACLILLLPLLTRSTLVMP